MGFVSRSIVLGQDVHGSTGCLFKNSPFEMKDNPNRFFKTEDIIESQCFVFVIYLPLHHAYYHSQIMRLDTNISHTHQFHGLFSLSILHSFEY